MLRFRVSESIDQADFLHVGEGCADWIQRNLDQFGTELIRAGRVLDFGCGCGRTMRWFLSRFPHVEFHGTDVDVEALSWCQYYLSKGHYVACQAIPPLPYRDQCFDVIYCLSVFTHLNEEMQDAWLSELRRILRPDGTLLLTVYGEMALSTLNPSDRCRLMGTGFIHVRSGKLRGLVPDWYHTTWHSREYIVARLRPMFERVEYIAEPGGRQNLVICKGNVGNSA